MCERGDTVLVSVVVPALRSHTGEDRPAGREVDRCIAPIVRALNAGGVHTMSSCCGHGVRPGSVLLADGRELLVCPDLDTANTVAAAIHAVIEPVRRAAAEEGR